MKSYLLTIFTGLLFSNLVSGQYPANLVVPESAQPYPVMQAVHSGPNVPDSPDPLAGYRWKSPQASDNLEVYALTPVSIRCDKRDGATWSSAHLSAIAVKSECSLMFDFGRVSAGWLEFDSDDLSGEVEMSISEYNLPAETNTTMVKHSKKTTVPVKYGNSYRLELNDQLYEGVRFGWIHIRKFNRPFVIKQVRLVCQVKPTNYEGSFNCNDATLNKIWYTGAYTVKLNFLKDYFGAILMDRGDRYSWTGDAHISQYASLLAFGNYDFVKENLVRTANDANGIASYSLYWVQSLVDFYNFTNDKMLFEKYLLNACGKLDSAYINWGKNPKLGFYGWDERLGAGFETPDCEENQLAYKMLAMGTCRTFGDALKSFGKPELANKYYRYVNEKAIVLRADAQWFSKLGLHSAADAVNARVPDNKEQLSIWNAAFSNRLNNISFSPFNQYFVIRAMANMNKYSEALTAVDDCWGGQIRNGATTSYEIFHPSWNSAQKPFAPPVNMQYGFTSLTHPWSAGATRWLSEEILGVKPSSPGFSTFIFQPHLSAEVNSVAGTVPTPFGKIAVAFDLKRGSGSIVVPPGTIAKVGIPKAGMKIREIWLNEKIRSISGEDQDFIYFENVKSGEYAIKVSYIGSSATAKPAQLTYPYRDNVAEDSVTAGQWKGKYGRNGYLLCNFDGQNMHRKRLPGFVADMFVKSTDNFRDSVRKPYPVVASDRRALQSDISGEQKRSTGILNAITTTVEISCKEPKAYKLSLYFTDWENEHLSSMIEVFDLQTKNVLMPDHFLSNYQKGKYITLMLKQSVRIRIQRMRGENTALGGIFFDN